MSLSHDLSPSLPLFFSISWLHNYIDSYTDFYMKDIPALEEYKEISTLMLKKLNQVSTLLIILRARCIILQGR